MMSARYEELKFSQPGSGWETPAEGSIKVDGLTKPFTESVTPAGSITGSTAATSLAEKLTSNLIAAIDSAAKFSSKCPDLPSLAFR
jgi:hypothetical protein